jgi:SPP1 family predicted phage head-tail adaptor
LRSGLLRHRLTIEEATDVIGDRGGVSETWSTVAQVAASIAPIGGSERFISQQRFPDVSHEIAIRYRAGITPKMRLTFGARVFDILAVLNVDERNREMRIMAREVV